MIYGLLRHFKCIKLQREEVKWQVYDYTAGWCQSHNAKPGPLLTLHMPHFLTGGKNPPLESAMGLHPVAATF